MKHILRNPALPLLCGALLLAGCGSSGDTTGPGGGGLWNSTWPQLPEPGNGVDPGQLPMETEPVTMEIRPYDGLFAPAITDMRTSYTVELLNETVLHQQTGWASELPAQLTVPLLVGEVDVPFTAIPAPQSEQEALRLRLAEGGTPTAAAPFAGATLDISKFPLLRYEWLSTTGIDLDGFKCFHVFVPAGGLPAATQAPSIKVERFWRRVPLDRLASGGGLDYGIVDVGAEVSYAITQRRGMSITEAYEFSRSITTTVGASYGAASAEVSVTLSETFSESEENWEESETTTTRTVSAPADRAVVVMHWELVRRYSFCFEDGSPYTVDGLEWPELAVEKVEADWLKATPVEPL